MWIIRPIPRLVVLLLVWKKNGTSQKTILTKPCSGEEKKKQTPQKKEKKRRRRKRQERTLICLCLLIMTSRAQVTHPITKPENYASHGCKHASVTESKLCLFFLNWWSLTRVKVFFLNEFLVFWCGNCKALWANYLLENGALEKCFFIIIITWQCLKQPTLKCVF